MPPPAPDRVQTRLGTGARSARRGLRDSSRPANVSPLGVCSNDVGDVCWDAGVRRLIAAGGVGPMLVVVVVPHSDGVGPRSYGNRQVYEHLTAYKYNNMPWPVGS